MKRVPIVDPLHAALALDVRASLTRNVAYLNFISVNIHPDLVLPKMVVAVGVELQFDALKTAEAAVRAQITQAFARRGVPAHDLELTVHTYQGVARQIAAPAAFAQPRAVPDV
jgi:hypothetical protein